MTVNFGILNPALYQPDADLMMNTPILNAGTAMGYPTGVTMQFGTPAVAPMATPLMSGAPVNPFVAGVLATIGAELLIIVLGAIITVIKKG